MDRREIDAAVFALESADEFYLSVWRGNFAEFVAAIPHSFEIDNNHGVHWAKWEFPHGTITLFLTKRQAELARNHEAHLVQEEQDDGSIEFRTKDGHLVFTQLPDGWRYQGGKK